MYHHISDAIKSPSIIALADNLYVARFETMKVYSALAAVRLLLERGIVKKGDTLLDSSSGVYAHALALACHKYGLKCHIIASEAVDEALRLELQLMGTKVELLRVSREGEDFIPSIRFDQESRLERVRQILDADESIHWMQQYHDDIHYAGYEDFADLVAQELDTSNLMIVGGVGSGCSTGALATHLRNKGTNLKLVGVQPFGSVTFGSDKVMDSAFVVGMGSGIECRNVRHHLYDEVHWLSDIYCLSGCIALLGRHGIFAGQSSGACFVVASWKKKFAHEGPTLFIAADTGYRYVHNVYRRANEAKDIDEFEPKTIESIDELSLPWSAMHWS